MEGGEGEVPRACATCAPGVEGDDVVVGRAGAAKSAMRAGGRRGGGGGRGGVLSSTQADLLPCCAFLSCWCAHLS